MAAKSLKVAGMSQAMLVSPPMTGKNWDPLVSSDWDGAAYPPGCYMRIKQDLKEFARNPPPDIFLVPRASDLSIMDFLIIGPRDTPYEGGFFNFVLRCPPDYPLNPPRVRLMTTGCGTVRFNPNLYRSGMVCLSILGTWSGPSWTAALGLSSLMISIQSLMTENPYLNEPGYEKTAQCSKTEKYCRITRYETLRVAVVDALLRVIEDPDCLPEAVSQAIVKRFNDRFDYYLKLAEKMLPFEGQELQDPFEATRVKVEAKRLLAELKTIREKVTPSRFPFLNASAETQCLLPEGLAGDLLDTGFPEVPPEDPRFLVENMEDDYMSGLSDSGEDAVDED